uniref:Uncharacterized protein n=1 Tax=Romanomermis culicivorax TaxID=13658 RepID=A0A915KVY9_ROMCU
MFICIPACDWNCRGGGGNCVASVVCRIIVELDVHKLCEGTIASVAGVEAGKYKLE